MIDGAHWQPYWDNRADFDKWKNTPHTRRSSNFRDLKTFTYMRPHKLWCRKHSTLWCICGKHTLTYKHTHIYRQLQASKHTHKHWAMCMQLIAPFSSSWRGWISQSSVWLCVCVFFRTVRVWVQKSLWVWYCTVSHVLCYWLHALFLMRVWVERLPARAFVCVHVSPSVRAYAHIFVCVFSVCVLCRRVLLFMCATVILCVCVCVCVCVFLGACVCVLLSLCAVWVGAESR